MRLSAVWLSGLFLFGVYALPGKVCGDSSAGSRDAVAGHSDDVNLPPCHRRAAAAQKSPCGKMVCCLMPDIPRESGAAVVLPMPPFAGLAALPAASPDLVANPIWHRTPYEAQAPPGPSGRFSFSVSPRGPPLV